MITDSDIHSSLHPNCQHQMVFAKLNLDIVYPPPYLREIWQYKEVNTGFIRRGIKEFNWETAFSNTRALMKKLMFLTELLTVIF